MNLARLRGELRKRRPHLLIGCAAAGLGLGPAGWMAAATAAAVATAVAWWTFGSRAMGIAAAMVLGAAMIGALRIAQIDRPAPAAPPGSAIEAEATLLEHPRQGLYSASAPMKIESGPAKGLRILARNSGTWPAVDPGVRFRLRGFVRTPAASAAGASGAGSSAGGASGAGAPAGGASGGTGEVPSEANAGVPGT